MPSASSPTDYRNYWDGRYRDATPLYGLGANQFVVEHLSGLEPTDVLDAACGQGRNAVWLAAQGHRVTGVDISPVAIEQARALAAERSATVEFVAADLRDFDPGERRFGLIVLSYLQLPVALRRTVHRRLAGFLAQGGRVFAIAHHLRNLSEGVGGPDYPEVLYVEDDFAADFDDLEIERNEQVLRTVDREDMSGTAIDLLFIARRTG